MAHITMSSESAVGGERVCLHLCVLEATLGEEQWILRCSLGIEQGQRTVASDDHSAMQLQSLHADSGLTYTVTLCKVQPHRHRSGFKPINTVQKFQRSTNIALQ